MLQLSSEALPIRDDPDLLRVRQMVRQRAMELGFGLVDQTKLVTAASELGRNTFTHGGGGSVRLETWVDQDRKGLRLTFQDHGPGISDIQQAMTDGFSTARGLGLGLGGSKRLMNEFEIFSRPSEGTRVMVMRWT